MQFLQTLFARAACGTLAALLLLCLAGRLKAHPPSPRAMLGVPSVALAALLALAAAVGSRAVPKSRAPTAEPYVSQLPVAVPFSDGNPDAPLVYRERLTPNVLAQF